METFKNCPSCGKLFKSYGNAVCQMCTVKEERDFKLVKEYIYDHENVNIVQVSEGTGVSAEKILRFLKQERLILTSTEGNVVLVCESCGRPIQTGRFCFSCKKELEASLKRELDSTAKKTKTDEAVSRERNRMYTASLRK